MKQLQKSSLFTKTGQVAKNIIIETNNGKRLLLCISDISEYEDKRNEFNMMKKIAVAVTLGQEEVDYSNEMMKLTLDWFDNFNNLIPSWYLK